MTNLMGVGDNKDKKHKHNSFRFLTSLVFYHMQHTYEPVNVKVVKACAKKVPIQCTD